jgi:hypothetical protein
MTLRYHYNVSTRVRSETNHKLPTPETGTVAAKRNRDTLPQKHHNTRTLPRSNKNVQAVRKWKSQSSGVWSRAVLSKFTDVSDECIAIISSVKELTKQNKASSSCPLLGLASDTEDGGRMFQRNVVNDRTIRHHIPGDSTVHSHSRVNLKSNTAMQWFGLTNPFLSIIQNVCMFSWLDSVSCRGIWTEATSRSLMDCMDDGVRAFSSFCLLLYSTFSCGLCQQTKKRVPGEGSENQNSCQQNG